MGSDFGTEKILVRILDIRYYGDAKGDAKGDVLK